jgi:hypothetical protein
MGPTSVMTVTDPLSDESVI